jgi:Do/DeqQ family serine protease
MSGRERFVRPRSYYIGAAALILIGLVIGLGLSAGIDFHRNTPSALAAGSTLGSSSSGPLESPFVSVVQKTLPAVVFVDVKKKVGADGEDMQDDLMKRFFGEGTPHRQRLQPSSGSGFIIDSEGHVLTNNHVVRDASEITVTLNDRRSYKATVVGTDPETDVAVIKIKGSDLPSLPLGDSDQLRVGDWAIAIGNPLGQLRGSVTVGIISAQGRSDLNIYGGNPVYQDFIQTDASINFGNSGGPLCNIHGEAIGINTAINPSGQGIGFAIPINLAKHVAEQLIASGSVKRAWMGIMPAELTPELAEGFGLKDTRGILVQNVVDGTPASKAGLRRNDVILEYDGQPYTDVTKFRLKVADTPVGKSVPMVILRDGKRMTVSVTVGERNEAALAQGAPPETPEEPMSAQSIAGLKVRDLSDEERRAGKVHDGVMVTDVSEGSAADDAGIQANDIIEEIGGKPANSAASFARALRDAKANKKHAVLLVNRAGSTQFIALRLD